MRQAKVRKVRWFALSGCAAMLAILVSVCLMAQGPAVGRADAAGAQSAAGQTARAVRVGAEVARANLTGRLEAALGRSFGGVWFDPSGTRLHVGVTSRQSRRVAEVVATKAGLAGVLVPTPVQSTWAQLQAAQTRWNDRLAGLFSRGRASTSLIADLNSVQLELSSAVSASRRVDLERQVAEDPVDVRLEVLPSLRFRVESWAQCAQFAEFKAYCDPTLVSGQSINDEGVPTEGKGECTAGPLVINNAFTSEADPTETFLLTAGHCITKEGAVGKKWYAYEKQGEPFGRKEIGTATAALIQEKEIGVDVGVIALEAEPWKTANDPPLAPGIARWSSKIETNPFPVIKQVEPAEGETVCSSGQRTGLQCGEIVGVGKVQPIGKGEWQEVVEVEIEEGEVGKGDSGAPVFTKGPYEEDSEGYVLGIVVGGPGEVGPRVYVQPLSFLLAELENRKGLNFELLRRANEERHNGVGKFHTSLGYTTLTAGQTGSHEFTAGSGFGGITCEAVTFDGMQVEKTSEEATVTPTYQGCKDTFGRVAHVTTGGATYTFHSSGSVDISGTIEIKITNGSKTVVCTVVIPKQTDNGITYANEGTTQVKVTAHSTNVKNTTSGGFFNCGVANGEHKEGTYDGTSVVSGESAGEKATLRYE